MYNLNRQNIRVNNLKKELYIAKRLRVEEDDYGNQITIYDKPKKYYFNVMPVNTSSEALAFGQKLTAMKVAVITKKDAYMDVFDEFDAVYLDGAKPSGESVYGANANYRIYAVQPQNAIIKIYFSRIVENN